jgi:GNAT superfamily N-acetyltransferase
MEIINAQIDDLSVILDLQKRCYNENALRYNDFNIAPLTQTIDELEREHTNCLILKAVELSKIVGSIRAFEKDETCYIGRVIVHPDYQNKGIGKKMMIDIEKMFPNVKRYELFTGFHDDKNLYFYNTLGYKQFKQVKINADIEMVYLEKINLNLTKENGKEITYN